MNVKYQIFVLVFMLFSGTVNGQVGRYEPGLYVTTAGDTIAGYIRDNISLERSDGFYFKAENDGEKAVFISGASFRSLEFNEKDRYLTLPDAPGPRIVKGVVEGPVSLYRGFEKNRGDIYFLIEPDSVVQIDKDNYRQKVIELSEVCPQIDTAGFVRYRHKEFIELTRLYNACRYPGASIEVLEEARSLSFRFGGMLTWNSGDLELEEGNYYRNGSYGGFSSFGGGLIAELEFTRQIKALAGLTYFRQVVSSDSVNVIPYDVPKTHSRVTFKMNYLELPLTVQFGWPLEQFRPFAELGIYLGIPLSRKVEENLTAADPEHENFRPDNNFRGWNTGFIGGAGVGIDLNDDLELQLLLRYVTAGTRMESLSTGFGNVPLTSKVNTGKLEVGLRLLWRDLF